MKLFDHDGIKSLPNRSFCR